MLRSCLINPYSLTALIFCCALGSGAMAADQTLLKIDINSSANVTYADWEGWIMTGTGTDGVQSKTFSNGIKVGFVCPWYTTAAPVYVEGFSKPYYGALCGDMAALRDPAINQGDITMTISYLAPGDYTLKTYHNPEVTNPATNNLVDVNDRIGTGAWTRQVTDFDQPHQIPSDPVVLANPVTLNFTIPQVNTDYQAAYVTSFKHRTVTDPNVPTDWIRRVGICGFELIAHNIRAAYGPNPVPESRIRWNTTYSLSWSAPDPYTPGDTLVYDVYFTTNAADLTAPSGDPNFPAGRLVATGTTSTTVPYAMLTPLVPGTDYYWRVDTWGLQGGILTRTVGMVWHFDTDNQAPTLNLGLAQVSFPGRTITLNAVATDLDELPAGRTITYTWTYRYTAGGSGDPNADPNYDDVKTLPDPLGTTASVSFVLDPNAAHVGTGRSYSFRCVVTDGDNDTTKDTSVFIANETRCQLVKHLSNYYNSFTADGVVYPAVKSAGDFNDDCITDFKDMAIYANSWLVCQAVNSVCP